MEQSKKRRLNFGMAGVIWALAWPTMLEQLMQTAVQYIDTAMVGSLGTQATAAVGATTTLNWLVGSTISAVVARVKATADGAVASYNRHTAGCACPEESQGQG